MANNQNGTPGLKNPVVWLPAAVVVSVGATILVWLNGIENQVEKFNVQQDYNVERLGRLEDLIREARVRLDACNPYPPMRAK